MDRSQDMVARINPSWKAVVLKFTFILIVSRIGQVLVGFARPYRVTGCAECCGARAGK
jgi:hypothetical protein